MLVPQPYNPHSASPGHRLHGSGERGLDNRRTQERVDTLFKSDAAGQTSRFVVGAAVSSGARWVG